MIEIDVYQDGKKIGEAGFIPEMAQWEVHPEPVYSNPWFYRGTVEEAVKALIEIDQCYERTPSQALGDDVENQEPT